MSTDHLVACSAVLLVASSAVLQTILFADHLVVLLAILLVALSADHFVGLLVVLLDVFSVAQLAASSADQYAIHLIDI